MAGGHRGELGPRLPTVHGERFDVALELEASEVLTTPLIPGFSLLLAELFAL
jgi:hypothetical protein